MTNLQRLRTTLWLALGLGACGETFVTEACLDLPDNGECPTAAEAKGDLLGDACSYNVISIDGEAEIKPWPWAADTDPVTEDQQACCYPATGRDNGSNCVIGRPLVADGELRTAPPAARTDWSAPVQPDLSTLSAPERQEIGEAWLRTAAGEHASVAAFARLALELMRLGAPADLLRDVHAAALDEVRHAEQAYALASAYLGRSMGPGPLPLPATVTLASTAAEVALAAASEGCRDETLAALVVAESAARASDPAVRAVLAAVSEDEARHAALSWRVLRWALSVAPEATPSVEALLTASAGRPQVEARDASSLVAHGVLGPEAIEDLHRRGMERVVAATWRALAA